MMPRPIIPLAILTTSLATLCITRVADAGTAFGLDADLAFPISDGSRINSGGGVGARFGYELHLPLIICMPELGFNYHGFGGDLGPNAYRAIAGGRVGFGELVRIGALAHVGYGHLDAPVGPNYDGFTWDAGGFVTVTAIPILNIGVHVTYNQLDLNHSAGTYQYLTTGLDLGLVF
jgi:hypothetical protein